MKYATILAATVAVGALCGVTAPAQAKAVKKKPAAVSAEAAEVKELRAEVAELKARLDARDAAAANAPAPVAVAPSVPPATTAAINSAATQATSAQASADKAQATADKAQAAADKATTDVGALDKVLGWAKDTKISGRMYFNASNITREVNGVKTGSDNGSGFSIKRFYVGIDHKFSNTLSGNITTDVSSISGVGQALYIKKAYLDINLDKAFDIKLGATDMPWIPYVEGVYGYRHIEQTVADRTKYGTSSDWGIHVMGSLADGIISYQVSAVDGGGYRNPQFTQTIDLEGRVSLAYMGFNAAVGGYTGKLGKDVYGVTTNHTASRFNALLDYKGKMFQIGAEYFHASEWNQVTSATADSSDGYSFFGNVNFVPKWSAFARYDWVKPNNKQNNAFRDEYFNVGLQYSPAKIVDLALVYKRDRAANGAINTGNGVIGCSSSAAITCTGAGTYDEIGLFGQFRF